LGLHGQGGDAESFAKDHKFRELGEQIGFISAYPQGMHDVDEEGPDDQGTGWNEGSSGDNSVCTARIKSRNVTGCYKSCARLNRCGRCNWATCYDDALFIKVMIRKIADTFCIDLARVYLQGESNGAQLLHHVVRRLPGTFAAVTPWFGQPLVGKGLDLEGKDYGFQGELSETAMMHLHLRHDVTIPLKGGVSEDQWIFTPIDEELGKWAKIHQCLAAPVPIVTRWDGTSLNFRCEEYTSCASGRRVIKCLYDGEHGTWPEETKGNEIAVWFFFLHARTQVNDILRTL
jgi:poly(3-hydroxybutyrate) depolymerase